MKAAFVIVLLAGAAHADDYPQALVARPLMLPLGAVEGEAAFGMDRISGGDGTHVIGAAPAVRFAAPLVQLEARADFALSEDPEPMGGLEHVQSVGGAMLARICTDFAAGVDLTVATPGGDVPVWSPRAVIVTKWHASPRAAVVFAGFAGADHEPSLDTLVAGGQLRAQVQLSPALAFEAQGTFQVLHALDADLAPAPTALAQSYALRAVYAASPAIDLIGAIEVIESNEHTRLSVAVVMRRLP